MRFPDWSSLASSPGRVRCLADRELVRQQFVAAELDDDSVDAPAVVFRAGIQGEGAPDVRFAPRFVDMAVERDEWLVLQNRLAHRGAAHRNLHRLAVLVNECQVLPNLARSVQPRVVRRYVKIEDARLRILELLRQPGDP